VDEPHWDSYSYPACAGARWELTVGELRPKGLALRPQSQVEVERRADKGQVGEGLGEVTEGFS
jgi:hypothetical protein